MKHIQNNQKSKGKAIPAYGFLFFAISISGGQPVKSSAERGDAPLLFPNPLSTVIVTIFTEDLLVCLPSLAVVRATN
jgi:hypothetical protein